MHIPDLRGIASQELLEADVCVIGSGPAGATIIRELAGTGLRAVLLESGGRETQPSVDALSEVENVGWPRCVDQSLLRPRILGGASHLWTGRCAPLDDIDYERRDWVPHSGWPLGPEVVAPYLDRTVAHLGLGIGSGYTGEDFWRLARRRLPRHGVKGDDLLPFFWQYSRDERNRFESMRFGPRLLRQLPQNVRLMTDATVLHINTNPAVSAVQSVEVASPDGRRWTVIAPNVVLCAGGIENARLLLASNRTAPAGLGNQNDLVGRFLMDHPRGSVASFAAADYGRLRRHFGAHNVRCPTGNQLFYQGMRLGPAIQRREGLLNCAVWLTEMVAPDDPWSALKRVLRDRAVPRQDALAIMSNLGLFTRGIHRHLIRRQGLPRKFLDLRLSCIVEQRPDRDSRVTLSERLDRFGVPMLRVDWRVNEQEQRTVRRMAELVAAGLEGAGNARPVLDDWVRNAEGFPSEYRDVAHPTGTTRMSADPSSGVVDADCQVHGINGLYVAGSSVFPTGGHANPTQMIVALAVRLADTLKARHRIALPHIERTAVLQIA